jgi:hypothetical protein
MSLPRWRRGEDVGARVHGPVTQGELQAAPQQTRAVTLMGKPPEVRRHFRRVEATDRSGRGGMGSMFVPAIRSPPHLVVAQRRTAGVRDKTT